MKKTLLILLLYPFTCFVICSFSSKTNDSIFEGVKTNELKIKQLNIDKTIQSYQHTLLFKIDTLNDKNSSHIILCKEKEETDYLKYLLPVFTLLLGIFVKYIIDIHLENKKIKKAGKRWIAELRSLESPLEKQIKELHDFIEIHNKETFETPELTIYSILTCKVFSSLDKSEFLHFLESNKSRDYNKAVYISNRTHGYINVLIHLNEVLQLRFNEYLKNASSHIKSLHNNLQILLRNFGEYGILIEKEIGQDPVNDIRYRPLLDLISTHVFSLKESRDYKILYMEKAFFLPFLAELSYLRLDQRTRALSEITSQCINDIKEIRMQKRYIVENINRVIKRYEEQSSELEIILKDIEN